MCSHERRSNRCKRQGGKVDLFRLRFQRLLYRLLDILQISRLTFAGNIDGTICREPHPLNKVGNLGNYLPGPLFVPRSYRAGSLVLMACIPGGFDYLRNTLWSIRTVCKAGQKRK